jgi:hypothetical protein
MGLPAILDRPVESGTVPFCKGLGLLSVLSFLNLILDFLKKLKTFKPLNTKISLFFLGSGNFLLSDWRTFIRGFEVFLCYAA